MKKILILSFLIMSCASTKPSQKNDNNIDLFFNNIFSLLQTEVQTEQGIKMPFDESNHVLVSAKDSLYILNGVAEALVYMENLTSINAAVKNPGQYTSSKYVNINTLDKWRSWYNQNRNKLVWDSKSKHPKLKRRYIK